MKGKELIVYKKSLVLTIVQKEVLFGTLLGDATIPRQKLKGDYNVKFEQKYGNKQYVDHLYEIFKNFVGTGPAIREIKGGGAADRYSVWFRTYRHSFFTEFYNIFYENGKKIVPYTIYEMFTARSLAFWFMDDGHKMCKGKYSTYLLNTYAFTVEDQLRLCKLLKDKFDIDCILQKDDVSYRIYIRRNSTDRFKNLIFPFMVDCMKYKL